MAAHQARRSASPAVERADCGVPVAALDQVELLTQSWPVQPGPPDGSQRRTLSAATCALHPEPVAVGVARRFTRTTLAAWQLDRLADDVSVVVSELVTNALRHALTVDPRRPHRPAGRAQPCGRRPPAATVGTAGPVGRRGPAVVHGPRPQRSAAATYPSRPCCPHRAWAAPGRLDHPRLGLGTSTPGREGRLGAVPDPGAPARITLSP